MILENKSKEFEIMFNNKDFTVPEGQFEVGSALGHYIKQLSKQWGKSIDVINKEDAKHIRDQITKTKQQDQLDSVKELPKMDTPQEIKKEEIQKEKTKIVEKESDKKLEDLLK